MNYLGRRSFLNALGTIAYVAIVACFMNYAERIFGEMDNTILAPITFLTLLVFSAAITGGLVLGKPLLMYLDNQKADAVKLFFYTLGWLFAALVIMLVIVALI